MGALPDAGFAAAGDRILLLGADRGEHGGAAWLRLLHGIEQGAPPAVDLEAESRLAELLRVLASQGAVRAVHDLSEGGLGVALAEACFVHGLGAEIQVPGGPAALFSESQARALLACDPTRADRVLAQAEAAGVPVREIGSVGGGSLSVAFDGGRFALDVEELRAIWASALPRALGV
jgi:phosphoribosylformylglycinamidine synthase